jgi:ribosomal protein L40E
MQRDSRQDVIRRAIRARICMECYQRPPGSETLSSDVPRACEPTCPIFLNVHALSLMARKTNGESVPDYEQQLQNMICSHCTASVTAGDFCLDRLTRCCPLSRYLYDVMDIIDKLNESDAIALARRKHEQKPD